MPNSRHPWQRKTERIFTPRFYRVAVLMEGISGRMGVGNAMREILMDKTHLPKIGASCMDATRGLRGGVAGKSWGRPCHVHCPEGGATFPAGITLPESAQTLAGIAFRAARKLGIHSPAPLKLAKKPSSKDFLIDLSMGLLSGPFSTIVFC